jgi:hypothetical protein
MSTSEGKISRKARKFEPAWTRYNRRAKFDREGRICTFCGNVSDTAGANQNHEQSPRHVNDRVERARQRKNSTIETPEVTA